MEHQKLTQVPADDLPVNWHGETPENREAASKGSDEPVRIGRLDLTGARASLNRGPAEFSRPLKVGLWTRRGIPSIPAVRVTQSPRGTYVVHAGDGQTWFVRELPPELTGGWCLLRPGPEVNRPETMPFGSRWPQEPTPRVNRVNQDITYRYTIA